ncbi:uncharacterized protein P174DRAFT_391941 [Aspergillus novofumigatus IBT 16806]|uniref:F-box domain-containing protein n=1 Tax=Aspergillus novofumigatus (strain IBT 16806) TaxID=1392255 RepID=A0A2I1C6E5_ASPN1|nr:uncharacterized protein P174DRAFT_391941 [Aspergillus novofumigatus IBT 16806]PKX93200.1 hypothetical protein P174DRAFT_391941 [Aspergillus novofumigatus IBT 16806]
MSRMRGSHELANCSDTQGHRREISRRKTDPRARSRQNASPLLQLPTEIIQYIAYLLPSDVDIVNLVSCCVHLARAILPAHSSIWRQRFKDLYGIPQRRSSSELKLEYQIRSIVLSQKINFRYGQKKEQTLWLEVLRDMLLEALESAPTDEHTASKLLEQIRKTLHNSEFLNRPVSGYGDTNAGAPSDLFYAVQLCLTHLALDPSMAFYCLRNDYDIGTVYSFQVDVGEPLVNIEKLDLEKILHIRNFWLRHLLNPNEATFYSSYTSLGQRPKATRPRGDSKSPSLRIKLDPDPLNWPTLFDSLIPILGSRTHCSYFRGIETQHGSDDDSTYLVRGFTEPIPTADGGFPNWRRICFAIYDADREQLPLIPNDDETSGKGKEDLWLPEEAWPPYDLEVEFNWIHGYEGVILPSGTITIGRWIDMVEPTARGPCIFWNV